MPVGRGRGVVVIGRPRRSRGSPGSRRGSPRRGSARSRCGDGGLLDAGRRARAQVVRRLQPGLPRVAVHRARACRSTGAARNRFSDWLWSMYGERAAARSISARCGSSHAVRNSSRTSAGSVDDALHRAVGPLDRVADLRRPQAAGLQLAHQRGVDLEELPRQRLALEQVGHLRLDALVAAGDRGDRRGRARSRPAASCAARSPRPASRSAVPALGLRRRRRPTGPAAAGPGAARVSRERRVRAVPLGQGGRRLQRGQVDLLGDPGGQLARGRGVERQPQREEHVLQPHHAEPDRPPARVGRRRLLARVVVDVDHPVEERHRGAHGGPQASSQSIRRRRAGAARG